jgi:hypothetical protein
MIKRINSKVTEADIYALFHVKWKEVEDECNQRTNLLIQNCANCIRWPVSSFPKNSTHKNFGEIKRMLQDVNLSAFGFRKPEKSIKYQIQEATRQVLSGSDETSMKTWSDATYRTFMNMTSKYAETNHWSIMGSGEKIYTLSDPGQVSR